MRARAGGLLLYAPVVRAEDFPARSPTWCAGSTRTPRPRTSCATCSTSQPGSPDWDDRARPLRRRPSGLDGVRRAAPHPGPRGRARGLGDCRRPVRERARHRLDAPGQPALDRPRTSVADGGRPAVAGAPRRADDRPDVDAGRSTCARAGLRGAGGAARPPSERAAIVGRARPTADRPAAARPTHRRDDRRRRQDGRRGATPRSPRRSTSRATTRARLGGSTASTAAAPQPLGVVVVAPPWNFPLSIPAGGVLAALAAGNAVILKPAPEAVLVGWPWPTLLLGGGRPARRAPVPAVPATTRSAAR